MYSSTLSLTSALGGGEWSTPRPGRLPRERPGTHLIGGWVSPRTALDRCGKSRSTPGFDPRTVQPAASWGREENYCSASYVQALSVRGCVKKC